MLVCQLALVPLLITFAPPSPKIKALITRFGGLDATQRASLATCPDYAASPIPNRTKRPIRTTAASLRMFAPDLDEVAIDFLAGCLEPNPRARMSVQDALSHPWIGADVDRYR